MSTRLSLLAPLLFALATLISCGDTTDDVVSPETDAITEQDSKHTGGTEPDQQAIAIASEPRAPDPESSSAAVVVSSDMKAEVDRVFAAHRRFDEATYIGMMQFINTGDEPATLTLMVRKYRDMDGVYERRAEIEIKGKVVLGENGILGYVDTFLRIQHVGANEEWKIIRRKAIIDGRLVIETEEDRLLYTIHGISPAMHTGFIEQGIKLADKE